MNRTLIGYAVALILSAAMADQARAGLAIKLDDIQISSGGTGTMNITITSDSQDHLNQFGLGLMITPMSGAASLLQFTTDQPDPFSNIDYVFAGHSQASQDGTPFWGPPGTLNYPQDTITGGDSYSPMTGYSVIGASDGLLNTYLATVEFQAPSGASSGEQFQVSLMDNPNFTYFQDENFNALQVTSVSGGLVTISSAVPEPSSLLLTLAGLGSLLGGRVRRRQGAVASRFQGRRGQRPIGQSS